MGRAIIMHIDDAPWIRGGPRGEGDHPDGGGQLVGDLEKGPWIHVNWLPGGLVAPVHSHDHDEIMVKSHYVNGKGWYSGQHAMLNSGSLQAKSGKIAIWVRDRSS